MILDAFNLSGKVAIVTGCDTGLGQGMALGLAQAGCDIVSVNRRIPEETAAGVKALGRRFMAIQADLSKQDGINDIVEQVVAGMGRVDILVNNAGTIRREDALTFSEKDWDDVMNLNLKSVFFLSQAVARQFIAQGQGGKIINIASMTSSAAKRSSTAFRRVAGASRKTCRVRQYFWPRQPRITSTAIPSPSMEAGSHVNRFVTKSYTVTTSVYCIKSLYWMH